MRTYLCGGLDISARITLCASTFAVRYFSNKSKAQEFVRSGLYESEPATNRNLSKVEIKSFLGDIKPGRGTSKRSDRAVKC